MARQTARRSVFGLILIAGFSLAACAEEENDPGSDAETDTIDDGGDTNTDVSTDGDDDTSPETDEDAETDTVDDTGEDADVADVTDTSDALDTEVIDDAGADVDADDNSDTSVDVDPDTEDCLLACGLGCVAPEFAPCGVDGNLYCSTCEMDCYGIEEAADRSICIADLDTCDPPDDATAVPYSAWTPPEGCSVETMSGFGDWISNSVYTAEIELEDDMDCIDENAFSGIDWSSYRLVRAVQVENPSIELRGVAELGGEITVFTASERYCGGAPPPSSAVWLLVPADERSVTVSNCTFGTCPDGPPRP